MTPEMENPWEKKRREEKERWAKFIAYVLTRRYAEEKERIEREYPVLPLDVLDRLLREREISARKLLEKKDGGPSCFELLERLEKLGIGGPFDGLLAALRQNPPEDAAVTRAVSRVVEEAPPIVVAKDGREMERRRERKVEPDKLDDEGVSYEERFRLEMTILREVMPPALYKELCTTLQKQGRSIDLEKKPHAPERAHGLRAVALSNACEAMGEASSGRTPAFHKAYRLLNRCVKLEREASPQEKSELTTALSEFVQTDCVPGNPERNQLCFEQSMRAIRALNTEEDFAKYVGKLNEAGFGGIEPEMFRLDVEPKRELSPRSPELERALNPENENHH